MLVPMGVDLVSAHWKARQRNKMRLEYMKSTNEKERQVRRQAHAKAILKGITMRQAVFEALEQWIKEKDESVESSRV